ncbi:MAG: HNH endonuclease [Thermoflexales bacterium]|nr:HNH endonuclease [Thermoflexales bacterium]
MALTESQRECVRCRANFRCEYCGVSEDEAGGELTVDHFVPLSKGGTNDLENLVYSCSRCNLYKGDYTPADSNAPHLWNPRAEPAEHHFREGQDGHLYPLTPTGEFTIKRLQLNRPALVRRRLRKQQQQAAEALLMRKYLLLMQSYHRLTEVYEILIQEQNSLLVKQLELLKQLREWLDES